MNEQEILDIVDKDGNILGQASREEVHNNPKLIHQVVLCWLFNSKGQILFQQRSFNKIHGAGKWDVSCAGHVLSGQTPTQTLQDELKEELGLSNIHPIFVEKYLYQDENQTELVHLYYAIVNKKIGDFKIQEKEVEQVEWMDLDQALKLVHSQERDVNEWLYDQIARIFRYLLTQ